MRSIAVVAVLALLGGGCGQAASTSGPPATTSQAGRISGVYVEHSSTQTGRGHPVAGVLVALFRRPISLVGPVMADPPSPIARTRTDAHGAFVFPPMPAGRYFVAAIGAHVSTTGRWAQPGVPIVLAGCSNCLIPM